jgi:hypothetical protein
MPDVKKRGEKDFRFGSFADLMARSPLVRLVPEVDIEGQRWLDDPTPDGRSPQP